MKRQLSPSTKKESAKHFEERLVRRSYDLREHIKDALNCETFLVITDADLQRERLFRLNKTTLKRCSEHVKDIDAVKKPEKKLYSLVAKLLMEMEISRFIHRKQVNKPLTSALSGDNALIMFIVRANYVQDADNGDAIRPDITGIEATAEEVSDYLQKDVLPDRLSALHWSQLVSVGEIKLVEMPDWNKTDRLVELLSCVWCTARCQPNRFVHTALMANKTGSVTLECHPDSSTILILYSGYGALIRYVHNLYYPQCRPRSTPQSRANSQT